MAVAPSAAIDGHVIARKNGRVSSLGFFYRQRASTYLSLRMRNAAGKLTISPTSAI